MSRPILFSVWKPNYSSKSPWAQPKSCRGTATLSPQLIRLYGKKLDTGNSGRPAGRTRRVVQNGSWRFFVFRHGRNAGRGRSKSVRRSSRLRREQTGNGTPRAVACRTFVRLKRADFSNVLSIRVGRSWGIGSGMGRTTRSVWTDCASTGRTRQTTGPVNAPKDLPRALYVAREPFANVPIIASPLKYTRVCM